MSFLTNFHFSLFFILTRNFISNYKTILRDPCPEDGLSCVPGNPVSILVNKLRGFSNHNVSDANVGPFGNYSDSDVAVGSMNLQAEQVNTEGEEVLKSQKSLRDANVPLSSRVLRKLQANCHSFLISGTELDFFSPSSYSHPIRHKIVAGQTFTEPTTASKMKADVDGVLQAFTREICSSLEDLKRESGCQSLSQEDPLSDTTSVGFETVQLKSKRQMKFENARNAASAGTGCECENLAEQKKCIFCRLESHYLGHNISPQVSISNLFQASTQIKLCHNERQLLTWGLLDSDKSPHICCGWLIEIDIDNLVMALYGISDIRLLWSRDERFKDQFSGLEVSQFQDLGKEFVPFSLFSPIYIHDIRFWMTEHMTEQQFLQDIYETSEFTKPIKKVFKI
ncbi:uncharacterized protein LOC110043481 isoform X2 [Orbicella faveolata]|uniref:uncharacterized protein LOC110043481 isoform X2 n=1 Tax=Orbicella faveolata TaxID=48498 RepID=UPI0009E5F93E|nr:uncharacterized protein LOC110043481 isoform X2 [Orbicella faveolata]